MSGRHGVLLAALLTSSVFLAPGQARADDVHVSTWLTNHASGLDAAIQGECQTVSCINGKGLALEKSGSSFNLVDVDGGSQIEWLFGNKCLGVFEQDNGTAIQMFNCIGGANLLWEPRKRGDGTVQIVNKWTGKCLDARNPSFPSPPRSGAVLQIWDCNEAFRVNQSWDFDF